MPRQFKTPLVSGPNIRAPKIIVTMLENCCFSVNASPNKGTPDIIKLGIQKFSETRPEAFEHAVRNASVELGLSVETIKQSILK